MSYEIDHRIGVKAAPETIFKALTEPGSMKWATFMLSLKNYLEKGKGHPSPQDIQIDYD